MSKLPFFIALGLSPLAPAAFAACNPQADMPDHFVCVGETTTQFSNENDNIRLEIQEGATLDVSGDPNDAVKIDDADGQTVTIDGRIIAEDKGIDADDDITITLNGSILAGGEAINVDKNADITINGTITAGDRGIDMGEDGSLFIAEGALIDSRDEAIEADDITTEAFDPEVPNFLNRGTILADEDGFQFGHGHLVNTGTITSRVNGDGVDADTGIIVNSGTIEARATSPNGEINAGIDVDEANREDASLVINNTGAISGGYGILVEPDANPDNDIPASSEPNMTAVQAINIGTGSITGSEGYALKLAGGNDSLIQSGTASLAGRADFGMGEDIFTFTGGHSELDPFVNMVYDELLGTEFNTGEITEFAFAGGAVIDGGAGDDNAQFLRFLFEDIVTAEMDMDGILNLGLDNRDGNILTIRMANWENFDFNDRTATVDEILASVAPVPLPAAGWMLIAGLAGMGAISKRRKT